jgi:menaquinone-dependent protoporphyrinogen oxidase
MRVAAQSLPLLAMKILVAYGSKHGSTREIAERITARLHDAGHATDVVPAGEVHDVTPYKAVVLGSAVYMRRWSRDASKLLKGSAGALAQRETWLFSSGPVGEVDAKAEKWATPKLVEKMASQIGAHDHRVFGGRVPPDPSNFMERAMARDTPPELQDIRDWDAIDGWAAGIARTLDGH